MTRFTPLLGILTILSVAFLFSKNRRAIRWRIVAWGFGLQILVAIFVLRTNLGYRLIDGASSGAVWMLNFAFEGSKFVFGWLGDPKGSSGFVFAFQALPMIIYVAAFFSILYYLRVLPMLVLLAGKVMFRLMKTSGAESLEVAASILMGQTEAPLVIRPYLEGLTESELMTVMTAGMAHIAGSVFGAYVLFGAEPRGARPLRRRGRVVMSPGGRRRRLASPSEARDPRRRCAKSPWTESGNDSDSGSQRSARSSPGLFPRACAGLSCLDADRHDRQASALYLFPSAGSDGSGGRLHRRME